MLTKRAGRGRTSAVLASLAAKTLRDPTASKEMKSLAGCVLVQRRGGRTSAVLASLAAKTLRDPTASKESKSLAGCVLVQRRVR
jgi:hypothetical protein